MDSEGSVGLSFQDGTLSETHQSELSGALACFLVGTSQDGNPGAQTRLTSRPTLGVTAGFGSAPQEKGPHSERRDGVGEPGRPSQMAGCNRGGDASRQPAARLDFHGEYLPSGGGSRVSGLL